MSIVEKLPNRSELTGVGDTITSTGVADSAQRMHMAFAQIQQAVMPVRPDVPISLTGFEPQMTQTTMAVVMPCHATIEEVILHNLSNRRTSDRTIIYRDDDTGILSSLELTGYYRAHDVFGAKLHLTRAGQQLRSGISVSKGTVLAHSVGANRKGVYTTGLCTNVANMSMKGTIEDGLIVSESYLRRASPVAMAKRDIEVGRDRYFVGAYSENGVFRPFPGNDEKIREDNLIFATRMFDDLLDSVNMLDDMIDKVMPATDSCVYAPAECKKGQVVNLKVFRANNNSRLRRTPASMEEALNIHRDSKSHYCNDLLAAYRKLKSREGKNITLGPELEELLTYALADRPNEHLDNNNGTVQFTHKAAPIDEWYVQTEIAWMYDLKYGAKLSDAHGNKGVICEIRPDEDMPTDEFGNRADYVQFGKSVFARMNIGQEYERYINAFLRDVTKDTRKLIASNKWDEAFNFAMGALKIVAIKQYEHHLRVKNTDIKKREWLRLIDADILRAMVPPDAGIVGKELVRAIQAYRRPDKSCVTYRNYDGRIVTTKQAILIAPKQVMVLDKSSFKPMAVSVAQRQQHGLPATTNKRTKVAHPTSRQPPRSWGESENRNLVHSMGGEAVAYQLDHSTNPDALRNALSSAIRAKEPFRVYKHLDREVVPVGKSRTIQFVKNLIGAMGPYLADSKPD